MRYLQEWEQSITGFDKAVRASFIQEEKRLEQIHQHLKEIATVPKIIQQPSHSTPYPQTSPEWCSGNVNLESRCDLTSVMSSDESSATPNDTFHEESTSDSGSLQGYQDLNCPKIEYHSKEYHIAQRIPHLYSVQTTAGPLSVREVPSPVISSVPNSQFELDIGSCPGENYSLGLATQ